MTTPMKEDGPVNEAAIERARAEGDVTWLARELQERLRVNVGLLAENSELRKKLAAPVATENDEPDFLEQEIAERTARNPDYPRLLAEAEARQAKSIEIEEARRLTLEPGDVLVVKVPTGIDVRTAERTHARVSQLFPDHQVLVMPADWDIETIRPEALGANLLEDSSPTTS